MSKVFYRIYLKWGDGYLMPNHIKFPAWHQVIEHSPTQLGRWIELVELDSDE